MYICWEKRLQVVQPVMSIDWVIIILSGVGVDQIGRKWKYLGLSAICEVEENWP